MARPLLFHKVDRLQIGANPLPETTLTLTVGPKKRQTGAQSVVRRQLIAQSEYKIGVKHGAIIVFYSEYARSDIRTDQSPRAKDVRPHPIPLFTGNYRELQI